MPPLLDGGRPQFGDHARPDLGRARCTVLAGDSAPKLHCLTTTQIAPFIVDNDYAERYVDYARNDVDVDEGLRRNPSRPSSASTSTRQRGRVPTSNDSRRTPLPASLNNRGEVATARDPERTRPFFSKR